MKYDDLIKESQSSGPLKYDDLIAESPQQTEAQPEISQQELDALNRVALQRQKQQEAIDKLPPFLKAMAGKYGVSLAGPPLSDNTASFLTGAVQGVRDVGQGLSQLAMEPGVSDYAKGPTGALEWAAKNIASKVSGVPIPGDTERQQGLDRYTQDVQNQRAEYEADPLSKSGYATAGRIAGNVAPYMAVPAATAPTAPARILLNTLTGGAIGGTQFVPEGDSRAMNIGKGALTSAVISGGLEGLQAGAGKIVNAIRGKYKPEYQQIADLAAEHKVPLSVGDMAPGPVITRAEKMAEKVPFSGMGKFRMEGDKAAAEAAQNLKTRFASEISDDWTNAVSGSMAKKLDNVKKMAAGEYDKVSKVADKYGVVGTPNMNKYATDIIEKELAKPAPYQDQQLINAIKKYTSNPEANFTGLRGLRSDIGDMISDYYKGTNAVVGQKGVGVLQGLKNSLEADMGEFAKQAGGETFKAWKAADQFYKTAVVPFKGKVISKTLASETPDRAISQFLSGGRDKAKLLFDALDDTGKETMRGAFILEATKKATSENGIFSPAKFASQMKKYEDASGVFFQGNDKVVIDGFSKLMRHASEHGRFAENPPTGQRVGDMLAAGGIAGGIASGNPVLTAVLGGTTIGSARLFKFMTAGGGKALTMAASKLEPGSPMMQNILDQALKQIPKAAAAAQSEQRQTK